MKPYEILKKVRKTSGISQVQLAKMLKIEQASISRIENGTQSIGLDLLIKLQDIYGLSIEQLVSGHINYYALAQKFGVNNKLKSRYQGQQVVLYREILPLLFFLKRVHDEETVEGLLKELKVEDLRYSPPEGEVSAFILTDLLAKSLKRGLIKKTDIPLLINEALNEETLATAYQALKGETHPMRLLSNLLFITPQFEKLYTYKIHEIKEDAFTFSVSLSSESTKTEAEKLGLIDFLSMERNHFFESLLNKFNFGNIAKSVEGDLLGEGLLLHLSGNLPV